MDVDKIKSLLLKRYRVKNNGKRLTKYDHYKRIICGYSKALNISVPHEIMNVIQDYCKLVLSTKIVCYDCDNAGWKKIDCHKCFGHGIKENSLN